MQIREIKVQSILTKTRLPIGGYAANPYVGCPHACKYCYASFMKRFTNHPEPWGEFLDVKFWPEIKQPAKYSGQEIFLSSVTDPYNPCEEQYKRTRALLLQLKDSGAKLTIQTKSDLILRDLDLLKNFQDVRVGFSINTLDENFKAVMDNAPSIARRINAMQTLYNSKIKTTCFIS
ncbi:MAG: radical SAM protein, partial [Synergistaceae bacterium]|nr:radical SAM protein [Synergistaceae bacterium]